MKFVVQFEGQIVLTVEARPGHLVSTAARPGAWPTHPFAHAIAHDAAHEHKLAEILAASVDITAFQQGLRAEGYALS